MDSDVCSNQKRSELNCRQMDCFGFDAKDCVNGVGGIADRREHMLTRRSAPLMQLRTPYAFPKGEVVKPTPRHPVANREGCRGEVPAGVGERRGNAPRVTPALWTANGAHG